MKCMKDKTKNFLKLKIKKATNLKMKCKNAVNNKTAWVKTFEIFSCLFIVV